MNIITVPDHRETSNNYGQVIHQAGDWRVITCRDGIQWIIQRASHGKQVQWGSLSFCTSRNTLLRDWRKRTGDEAPAALVTLPEHIRLTRK